MEINKKVVGKPIATIGTNKDNHTMKRINLDFHILTYLTSLSNMRIVLSSQLSEWPSIIKAVSASN